MRLSAYPTPATDYQALSAKSSAHYPPIIPHHLRKDYVLGTDFTVSRDFFVDALQFFGGESALFGLLSALVGLLSEPVGRSLATVSVRQIDHSRPAKWQERSR